MCMPTKGEYPAIVYRTPENILGSVCLESGSRAQHGVSSTKYQARRLRCVHLISADILEVRGSETTELPTLLDDIPVGGRVMILMISFPGYLMVSGLIYPTIASKTSCWKSWIDELLAQNPMDVALNCSRPCAPARGYFNCDDVGPSLDEKGMVVCLDVKV
ncbi:hypothetical protein EK21DRAFT_92090 [Setomelanomma holmii]|uniref:Uncharacterized protein n=1 Tax=Setomelanomma holmii TaxID=210430 RepID=A0A9P4H405_9PLEO|nr:hypothetical protein EK21DRAFT_92090 [Setomelanomma holmii]